MKINDFRFILMILILINSVFRAECKKCLSCPPGGGGTYSGIVCNDYCSDFNGILYVDQSKTSSGNGKSWKSAFTSLGAALAAANQCDSCNIHTIRVAKGTYKPTGTLNRDAAFFVGRSSLIMTGGFPSYPDTSNFPDHVENPTIIDGFLGKSNGDDYNSYHNMIIYGVGNVTINGFRFRNGIAGGIGSLEIDTSQYAGRDDGGGAHIRDVSSCRFVNCAFHDNFGLDDGGAVFVHNSNVSFINTIFVNNDAGVNGGGIYLQSGSNGTFTHCTFAKNTYYDGGGGAIYNTLGTNIDLYNSILWSNSNTWNGGGLRNVYHCLLQDNNTSNGGEKFKNNYIDPCFKNLNNINGPDNIWFTSDDGLIVNRGSICINRGLNTAPGLQTKDIRLSERIFNQQTDIGAYEVQALPTLGEGLLVSDGDSTSSYVFDGVSALSSQNCRVIALLEPQTPINSSFIGYTRKVNNFINYYDSTFFCGRLYTIQKENSGNFDGRISFFYEDTSDFVSFNSLSYSKNNLPTDFDKLNKSLLRVIKFPNVWSDIFPTNSNVTPEIIDPADEDITFNESTGYWKVTFENSGSLGTYYITTIYDFKFVNSGSFSDPNNWLNQIKPKNFIPSLNKVTISSNTHCIIDESIHLKPHSFLVVNGTIPNFKPNSQTKTN